MMLFVFIYAFFFYFEHKSNSFHLKNTSIIFVNGDNIKNKLSDTVIPNFIEVISYVEVNDLKNVNLNFSLSKCVHQIVDLADSNKNLMMLSSKYKVIREEIINLINLDDEE